MEKSSASVSEPCSRADVREQTVHAVASGGTDAMKLRNSSKAQFAPSVFSISKTPSLKMNSLAPGSRATTLVSKGKSAPQPMASPCDSRRCNSRRRRPETGKQQRGRMAAAGVSQLPRPRAKHAVPDGEVAVVVLLHLECRVQPSSTCAGSRKSVLGSDCERSTFSAETDNSDAPTPWPLTSSR